MVTPLPNISAGDLKGNYRWDPSSSLGSLYNEIYNSPKLIQSLKVWGEIAEGEGCSKAELSYRWVVWNSALRGSSVGGGRSENGEKEVNGKGDGVVIWGRDVEQLKGTMEGLKRGGLKPETVEKIEQLWEVVKGEAVLDNYNLRNM